ncbi:MAG: pyruvate dehydrogenase (acetyl-transferring) E1 component subunit alpha [Candidatus Nanohaloarchaeota archaeon QJJ-5]|nr:pyruvate dehydrogenase (acetyl-transferring) E1 component subunit alpha [Candidatus Nanohaloarchaeota archaeon QJJ-5]
MQILDKDGNVDEDLEPDLSDDELKDMYWHMILARVFDEKAIKMQRRGHLGTYAPCRGQEAAQVGSAYALDDTDWMFPAFRETASFFVRDFPPEKLFQFWKGDENGSSIEGQPENFMVSVPVGSQIPHAVGASWASKKKGDEIATLVYFGDGATSEGDFHEGMNFAGAFETPTVFLCQNNQYAISVPRDEQSGSKTLAQKALAYGIDAIQVDGNDILAVWKATKDALEQARKKNKPMMIETVTYRLGDHTTSDDAERYRDEEELKKWQDRDPIDRLETYMLENDVVEEQWFDEKREEAEKQVDDAEDKADELTDPDIEEMFHHHFEDTPAILEDQLSYLKTVEEERGDR